MGIDDEASLPVIVCLTRPRGQGAKEKNDLGIALSFFADQLPLSVCYVLDALYSFISRLSCHCIVGVGHR